jgi:hypothetical protein
MEGRERRKVRGQGEGSKKGRMEGEVRR